MALSRLTSRRSHQRSTVHTRVESILFLAGFSLLLTHPAAAQMLNLQGGDNVTVSNMGTSGVYQGMPINNTTSAYNNTASNSAVAFLNPNSTLTVNGGTFIGSGLDSDGLFANDGTVQVNAGIISGSGPAGVALDLRNGGTATITGGAFSGGIGLFTDANSFIAISGGSFFSTNPNGAGFAILEGSTIDIDLFGSFNGCTAGQVITAGGNTRGVVTGTLFNGQAINTTYALGSMGTSSNGTIEFNVGTPPAAVPEFSSAGSFGLCLVGLGVLVGVRKRQARGAAQP